MSTSLDPRTLATPNEHVVLGRGLGPIRTIRVLVEGADRPPQTPGTGGSDHPPGIRARSRLAWEVVETAPEDVDDVHVLFLGGGDTKGSRSQLLSSARPWVVLLRGERNDASDWERELADAKYVLAVFDGRTEYFVSPQHDDLPGAFASGDAAAWEGLVDEVVRWRTAALGRWALTTGAQPLSVNHAERELHAIRQTVSWRLTAPLRKVRARTRR